MKEEIVSLLENFCNYLYKFQYDKAKEIVDEFRTKRISTLNCGSSEENYCWSVLFQCLSQLAVADKCYMTLSFLLPKGFLRKESPLRSNYTSVRNDLRKLCDGVNENLVSGARLKETLVIHLCQQFSSYIDARTDMMNCYENLATLFRPNGVNIDRAVDLVKGIQNKHRGTFHHPLLSSLELSFSYELEVLINLLICNQKLTKFMFMDCLLHLKDSQSSLKIWSSESTDGSVSKFHQNPSWFPLTSASKMHSLPALCIWLKRFYDSVIAKFSLYFHELLSEQTNAQEMRNQLAKLQLNYYQQIVQFHRRHDAANICILLNVQDLGHLQWRGYRHPNCGYEALKGLENYPIIFCYPSERPSYLLPSVVMILNEHAEKLLQTERIVPVFDKTKETMFFVTRVESCAFLILTFNCHKSDRDSHVISFISELCGELRCAPVFSSLKLAK